VQEGFWAWHCQRPDLLVDRTATNEFKSFFLQFLTAAEIDFTTLLNERQGSVNDFLTCILGNLTADRLQKVITEILAALTHKADYGAFTAPS
jgi:hypothetical protein